MSRGKRAALICGVVVGVIIAFSFLLPVFLDIDRYRNYVAELVGKRIDRKVSMDHLKLSLWSGLGVELQNLTVSNGNGFRKEDFLSAKKVKIEVKALPLLKKRVEVKQVVLERPQILLELNRQGTYNFSDIITSARAAKTEEIKKARHASAAEGKALSPPATLAGAVLISRLSIKDGKLTFMDGLTNPGKELSTSINNIDLKVDNISTGSPFDVDLKAGLGKTEEQNLRLKGRVTPNLETGDTADFNFQMDAANLELSPLNPYLKNNFPLRFDGSRLAADIHVTGNTGKEIKASGKISLKGLRFSEGKASPMDLKLGLDKEIVYDLRKAIVTINPARLTIGETQIEIYGSVSHLKTKPELDLMVKSDNFNLDAITLFYPPLKDKIPKELSYGGKASFSVNLKTDGEKLTARGTMDLNRASLSYGKYFKKVPQQPMKADFQLTAAGETIQIDTLNAALGDFWFDLSGTVKTKPAPVVDLKFLTSPVKLETLKNFVPGLKEKNLKGSLRLEGTVQGPADEPDKLKFKIKTALIEIGRVEDIIEGFPEIAAGLPETLKIGGALSANITLSEVAKQIQVSGKARLDALKIIYGEYFHKPAGLPMGADFDITYGEENLTIKKLKLSLGKMGANVSGEIKDFKQPKLDIRISSAGLPLSQIARVVPPAEAYRPGGEITLNLRLSGAAQKLEELSASGEASFKGVNIVFPATKKTLRDLKGKVTLSGRSIKLRDASLTFGRTPLKVEADVKDFSSPRVIFALQSPLFMVEDFLPPERAKNRKSRGSKAPGKKGEVETPARVLAGVNAEGRVRIKRLVYKKLELTDLEADLTIDKGVIEVDPMAFNLFQGRCKGYANLDFSGAQPQFRVIADLNGLNVNSILQSQAGIGNVMKGTLSTTLDIRGTGDTYDTLSKTLNGKGKIKIENGSFTGFSMLRGLSSLTGAAGLGGFSKKQTPFDLIDTDFNLADGKVRTDSVKLNFDEYGLSATGYVGLDKSLAYDVLVTVGESMSKRVGRSRIGSLLLNRSGRMVVPLSVSGYLPKPKVSIKKEFLQKQFLEYGAGRLMKQFKGGSKTEAPDILKGILGGLGEKSSQQPRAAPQQEEGSREEKKPALDPGQILRDIFKSR